MSKIRMIDESTERQAFEDIIGRTFQKYRDNIMCSQSILDEITIKVTQEIRDQLKGIKREYIIKEK